MGNTTEKTPFRKSLLRYVVIGALATLLLVALKLVVEHTSWGHENQLWIFGKLTGSLPAIDLDNPVVVLDIALLPGGSGRPNDPTPRDELKKIITALVELEPKPRAIAVDVNFSPKGPKYSAEFDEDFFEFCLAIWNQKRVPVFLAVAETKTAPPEAWLGNEAYKELAVAAPGDKNDTSRIPLLVKSPESSEPLKTLNYALALEYRKILARPHPWIRWAVDTNLELADESFQHEAPIGENASVEYEERLVNFSKLQQMKVAAHSDIEERAIKRAAAKYSNKVVILGDLGSDAVYVPGYGIYPGSLVLASATYTLIKEPLFEFKWWVRLLLDLLIAAWVIVAIALIRRKSANSSWKQSLLILAAVLLVGLAGWGLVRLAGVLWLDFLLVALGLLLHPKTEHLIDRGIARLRKSDPDDSAASLEPPSAPSPPQAAPEITVTPEAKNTVAGLVILVLMASAQASAQQRQVPPGCEKTVAAVGVKLITPNPKSKKKSKKKQPPATCYFRENRNSEWKALTGNHEKRPYRAGNHVYCDVNCSLTLVYCGTSTEHVVNTQKPRWFPVIHAYRPPPLLDDKSDNFMRVSRTFSPPDPQGSGTTAMRLASRSGFYSRAVSNRSGGEARRSAGDRGGVGDRAGAGNRGGVGDRGGVRDLGNLVNRAGNRPAPTPAGDKPASSSKSEFGILLMEASRARRQREYASAHQLYLKAQAKDPKDYRVFQGLGNLYADQKEWSAAEQAYRDAVKAQPPRDSSLSLSLGFVILQSMLASGDHSRAAEVEQILRSANEASPDDERVYDLFEQFFAFQDVNPRKMAAVYKRGVSYNPDSVSMNLRYAAVLYRLNQPDEALRFVRTAEENAFDDELVLVAKVYENKGRYKDAERALRRALEWMPDDATVLYNLGSVLVQRGRFSQALKVLQKATSAAPDAFAPILVTGIAQLGKGDLAAAGDTFEKASLKLPEDTDAPQRLAYWQLVLGDKYRSKGKLDEAIRAYEKSLTRADNPDVRNRLLEVKQQRNSKAP